LEEQAMMQKREKKEQKPLDLIRLYHEVFSQGESLEEVAEFAFKKDYANNSL
jgi:hypothetical protein